MRMEIGGITLRVTEKEVYAIYFALEYFQQYKGKHEWAVPIAKEIAKVIYSEDEEA